MLLPCTCQIYMTASAWGSWLITTLTARHSSGTMTAQSQSMWMRCNQYMGVLDSLYSAGSIYIVTRTSQAAGRFIRAAEKQTSQHPFLCAHSDRSFGIFHRDTS